MNSQHLRRPDLIHVLAILLAVTVANSVLVSALVAAALVARVEPMTAPGQQGVHLSAPLFDDWQIGVGVLWGSERLSLGGGIAQPGVQAIGEGFILDWKTQAIIRMSDQALLFYW
ncbi:MAG: hypothetical protein HYZ49_05705 [Chloroflexi bacterium]|nr:hypothetical protein [Chloroflexota bacterium]